MVLLSPTKHAPLTIWEWKRRGFGYRKYRSGAKEGLGDALVQDKALKSPHQQDSHPRLLLFQAVERVDPPRLRDPGTALLIDDPVFEDLPKALLIFEWAFEVCSQQRASERIDDLELPP